jgi:hypothetical protein
MECEPCRKLPPKGGSHASCVVPLGIVGLFGLVVLVGSQGVGLTQVRDPQAVRPTPVQTVANAAALQAHTPEDTALARFFDSDGPDLLALGNVAIVEEPGPEIPPPPPGQAAPRPIDPWTFRVCQAEVVIIGHAMSERALLNKSGSLLITISDMRVDRWLIPNTGAGSLRLATQGGKVRLGDRLVSAQVGSLRDYRRPWLLFLKKIPATAAFALSGSPIAAGETLPQANPRADTAAGHWRSLADRVTRVAAACGEKR